MGRGRQSRGREGRKQGEEREERKAREGRKLEGQEERGQDERAKRAGYTRVAGVVSTWPGGWTKVLQVNKEGQAARRA